MKLADADIKKINDFLKEQYGVDTVTGLVIFRVSYSEDQFEKRYGTYTDYLAGTNIFLRTVTEVREVPKYRQWIHERYVLERLLVVPYVNQTDLPGQKLSYEPIWVFEDNKGNYLPPIISACKFIVDTVLSAQIVNKMMLTGDEKKDSIPLRQYYDPEEESQEAALELKRQRVAELENELFGDETGLMGTTITGESIIVPQTYERKK